MLALETFPEPFFPQLKKSVSKNTGNGEILWDNTEKARILPSTTAFVATGKLLAENYLEKC